MSAPAPALHVAAMPFPNHQGTQAALCAMVAALARAGRPTALLTYAHGASGEAPPFPVLRSREPLRYASLRSGPSAHKLLADAALGVALLRARRRLSPSLIVAHHVEAAALAMAAARATLFFAHTDLEAELPSYAPAAWAPLLAPLGRALDLGLLRRAGAVAAISPLLAERMRALLGAGAGKVHCVPPPWPVPAPIDPGERARARRELGATGRVLLYAGNLDGYQGWEPIVHALAEMPRHALLVATQSDAAPLWREARRAGVASRVHVRALDGEAARRSVHAAADVAIVPRRAPGGLPIKLIDALARGVPCVVADNATAGLPLAGVVHNAGAADAGAIARAVGELLGACELRAELSRRGPRYVARHHGDAEFLSRYDAACAAARAGVHSEDYASF
jgi:glycosyltransferase involved in cell wall biosynthesis